ncbi:hypothetical protein CY34DRAFT_140091 [Suillus luteus UH-Slu-Lm8-n1]|uniref:Uncharacterized protein n=1 Tax=Suillus luteus UH-Slu-Lm8-n1 TaxID=930992 RepID=A0A0C9ZTF1_9AGAM|nr:hypothetical protein CY34DRAFT_140091 [Suillus luteus UH-Slu-Lm8-n1]
MPHPPQHPINAPSIPLPQSGAAPSHMGQLSRPPNPDSDLSAGPETYLVYCADEINRTSSRERLRSLARRASLCVFHSCNCFPSPLSIFCTEELSREKEKNASR